ncbi:MAG: hypothetical protein ACTHMC_27010 [Pseudobacter sp.]|uniref:hypothetical protein n=1 Tax=Pseudobacter sp. TaxID=2045420 RepID=UPI003F7F1A38
MVRILLLVAFLLNIATAFSQKKNKPAKEENFLRISGPSEQRFSFTIPPYGYNKVKKLAKEADTDRNSFVANPLQEAALSTLSPEEKFTWCMAFPESFMQICTVFSYDSVEYKILRYLPISSLEAAMSKRQRDFLKENRALTIRLMGETMYDSVFVGFNYKKQIKELHAVELVPQLISNYKRTGDKDLLTLLIELMEKDQYQPWLDSEIWQEMNQKSETRSFRKSALFTNTKAYTILKFATEKYVH